MLKDPTERKAFIVEERIVEYKKDIYDLYANPDLCEHCLNALKLKYRRFINDNFEIDTKSIIKTKDQKLDCEKIAKQNPFKGTILDKDITLAEIIELFHDDLKQALDTKYAKRTKTIRIEFI